MTRRELLKRLFPEVKEQLIACKYVKSKCLTSCDDCKVQNYWDEPAVISKEVAKSILNCVYGQHVYYDTDSIYFQYGGRGNDKTYAQYLALIHDGWTKFPSLHNNIDWSMLKDIIDDALDNGFEVKILNGTIYYREKQ